MQTIGHMSSRGIAWHGRDALLGLLALLLVVPGANALPPEEEECQIQTWTSHEFANPPSCTAGAFEVPRQYRFDLDATFNSTCNGPVCWHYWDGTAKGYWEFTTPGMAPPGYCAFPVDVLIIWYQVDGVMGRCEPGEGLPDCCVGQGGGPFDIWEDMAIVLCQCP